MLTIIADAPSNSGRMCIVRCMCGREYEMPRRRVPRTESCGCAMKRPPRVKVELPPVEVRLVPASKWMNDAAMCDALVALLNPPHKRLPYLQPARVADICAALKCEPHHVLRAPLSIALEWDPEGVRVWGRRIAAGDVFGPADVAQGRKAA